jgi:hypothetical protein
MWERGREGDYLLLPHGDDVFVLLLYLGRVALGVRMQRL